MAATIGGGLMLAILKDLQDWSWWSLAGAGIALVGGTLVANFVPDFSYRVKIPWARIVSGIVVVTGGVLALSALQPPGNWRWYHWLGTALVVIGGTTYLLLPDLQEKNED